ncbi:CBS domain-containing protein [Pelomicrobium sp.]|jgi:CBS domain-containing protein|uniref:CBS domain-containing protein n=1 Tax=Pelomicrobium sp. TaxID=2815319 RepID=UPI002FDEDC7D
MQAKDVMTTPVVTVKPETQVSEIARLLLERGISAVPVVDAQERLLGIVSEGDLMRRPESGTERRPSWWLALLSDPREEAREYVKSHGLHAQDIMTRDVITVEEDTPLQEIAALLEKHRIKRVPVVRNGKVVGIVSRANLLQALVAQPPAKEISADDRTLREAVLKAVQSVGAGAVFVNAVVSEGVVHLWGITAFEEVKNAIRVAAERVPGVKQVKDEIKVLPHRAMGYE